MKILLTNNHLNTLGGTETWLFTVYNELKRLGHDVTVYSRHIGATGISGIIPCTNQVPKGKFDLALINHNTCLEDIVSDPEISIEKLVFISHGTFPKLEQPVPEYRCDRYISVSKEVKTHIKDTYNIDSDVVLNPIDLDKYKPLSKINKDPSWLFVMVQSEEARQNLSALRMKTYSSAVNRHVRTLTDNLIINLCDISVSLGRGCYESLAAGRPVMIYDERHYNKLGCYDGLITQDNISSLLTKNCSGRVNNLSFDVDYCKKDIELNYVADTDYYRAIAEKYFDSKKIVQELIK